MLDYSTLTIISYSSLSTQRSRVPASDPAADHFAYPVSIDVRDLVTLEDVMEEMQLGPNGCALALTATSGRIRWG